MNCRFLAVFPTLVWATLPFAAEACNVPVFRYAMERWPADPYQLVIYHRGGAGRAALDGLRDAGDANYSVSAIDVTTAEGEALAGRRRISTYPWVEVYYPTQSPIRTAVWSGPLDAGRAASIRNSPARARLARQLLGGEVAVWVLVKSGNEAKDRRALARLRANLRQASATLRIPETGVDANGNAIEVTDFKSYPVRFGLMEVARDDPREELLVRSLLASEPDLARYDEPMAFPVFGRGRVLYALVGDGIDEENILEACRSMLAWCSCEIKAQNPGTDLLIAADWSRPAGGRMVKDPELPLTGLADFLPEEKAVAKPAVAPASPALSCPRTPASPVAAAAQAEAPAPVPAPESNSLLRNLLYLAAAAGIVLAAGSVILTMRARK